MKPIKGHIKSIYFKLIVKLYYNKLKTNNNKNIIIN